MGMLGQVDSPPDATTLADLEIASSLVLGVDSTALAPRPLSITLQQALEDVLLPALERPPCGVSFSGGIDSSLVLAAATRLARRLGRPDPIPVTCRFPGVSAADESEWQERVVRGLELDEWVRLSFVDELDVVGPVATEVANRHGVLWPANVHLHLPVLRQVAGGSLLTGIGGDEVFGRSRFGSGYAVITRGRSRRQALAAVSDLAMPRPLRRRRDSRTRPDPIPWLRPEPGEVVRRAWIRHTTDEPLRWSAKLRHWSRLRYNRVGRASLELLAADTNTQLVHPLSDPKILGALLHAGRWQEPQSRPDALRRFFPGALPADVGNRRTKAVFDAVFFNRHSRAVVQRWDGQGIDPDIVDVERLRSMWRRSAPSPQSYLLLQSVALAGRHSQFPSPAPGA